MIANSMPKRENIKPVIILQLSVSSLIFESLFLFAIISPKNTTKSVKFKLKIKMVKNLSLIWYKPD